MTESGPVSATGSAVLATIRARVPEFEETFQTELRAEDGEMGAFQAMSVFASWLNRQVQESPASPTVQRAFGAVEEIASRGDYPMGPSLVTEFVEALSDSSRAASLMGPNTRGGA